MAPGWGVMRTAGAERVSCPWLWVVKCPFGRELGADVSLLPRSHVAPLASPDARQYELEAFDGTKSAAPAVTAELQFLGKSFRGQFLLIENWHGGEQRGRLGRADARGSARDRQGGFKDHGAGGSVSGKAGADDGAVSGQGHRLHVAKKQKTPG